MQVHRNKTTYHIKIKANGIPFVSIYSLVFLFVNYFENVARRQRNVSEFQLNFIRVFLSIPECDDITSPNFELGSHLHFTPKISAR